MNRLNRILFGTEQFQFVISHCRLFYQTRMMYSFNIASMFFWTVIGLAASIYIFELVLKAISSRIQKFPISIFSILFFFNLEFYSENGTFRNRHSNDFYSWFGKCFMDLLQLFIGKIGHRSF